MITKNTKALLAGPITSYNTGSRYFAKMDLANGKIVDSTGTEHTLVYSKEYDASSPTLCPALVLAKLSTYIGGSPGILFTAGDGTINNPSSYTGDSYCCIANNNSTLTENDYTIASSADDFLATSQFSNTVSDGIRTITVSNTTSSDIVFNTIGVYQRFIGSSTTSPTDHLYFLLYAWQFDTITLAPGESVSIQISHGELST